MLNWLFSIFAVVAYLLSNHANAAVELRYEIIERLPHDRSSFTQGLELYGDRLYESTGQYGQSTIRHYKPDEPKLAVIHRLPRDRFGEGLTILNDRAYQLTWRSGEVYVYGLTDFSLFDAFTIPGDGWGLTNNGRELIYSDGSDKLRFIDPVSKKLVRTVHVSMRGKPVQFLNELEWMQGAIYANVLPTNLVVAIDPRSGEVIKTLDLSRLYPERMRRSRDHIANGLAWDHERQELFVTGKNWPWIYRIKLIQPSLEDLLGN